MMMRSTNGETISVAGASPDSPQIACGRDGCFVVWHGIPSGAFVAMLDPEKGIPIWHKRFAAKGEHPAIGASATGDLAVAYYEEGKVKLAAVSGEGVSAPSLVGRVMPGDPPRPWVTGGRAGEWYLAWLDQEAGHPEVAAARMICPR
jgi:serine/threonine-protein kinase